jgi:Ca2+/Na+ antiporter
MKLIRSLILFFIFIFLSKASLAQAETPDTVYTGIYITSIHDIDFKQKEFTVNLWLWLKYKNKDFDFVQNLEVPQAKTVVKSFSTIDTTGNKIYIIMKLQCVMKDSWKINSFPFDRQKLRLTIENSQYDSKSLIFVADTLGNHYDPRFTVQGWAIDSFAVSTRIKSYETAFGDDSQPRPHTEYSQYRVKIGLVREAMGMFLKMFIGMYVAFLIAFACFFIHADSIESRFGLSVGALFAVIGNKYVIDSALPESSSFTLVDTLHGITLLFIFGVIASSIYALNLLKKHEIQRSNRFDRFASIILLTVYLVLNVYYIWDASNT